MSKTEYITIIARFKCPNCKEDVIDTCPDLFCERDGRNWFGPDHTYTVQCPKCKYSFEAEVL